MKKLIILVLRGVALGTGIGMLVLAFMQKITVETGVLLLGIGQVSLALSLLDSPRDRSDKKD